MLVSRGAVYANDTAEFRAHDHCRCFGTPVFNDSQIPDESKRLAEEWAEVTQGTSGPKEAQQAWRDHIKTKTGGAGGGGRGKRPSVTPNPGDDDWFNERERALAKLLRQEGSEVVSLRPSDIHRQRNPDALVNRVATEFKSLNPGATSETIRNRMREAHEQSDVLIIDARLSGVDRGVAERGLARGIGAYGHKYSSVRIIGTDFDISWSPT